MVLQVRKPQHTLIALVHHRGVSTSNFSVIDEATDIESNHALAKGGSSYNWDGKNEFALAIKVHQVFGHDVQEASARRTGLFGCFMIPGCLERRKQGRKAEKKVPPTGKTLC